MSDDMGTSMERNQSGPKELYESGLHSIASGSELVMDLLELLTALLMLSLFTVGVFDLGLKLYTLFETGRYTDPNSVVKLIDTALLLLIIVEVYRTVVAYIEELNILPLVINVGMIAMARKIISFRVKKYGGVEDAMIAAIAYGFLLIVLIGSFYMLHKGQEITEFDVYSEPFSTSEEREETKEALATEEGSIENEIDD